MIVVKGGRFFNVILPIMVLPNDVRKDIVLFLTSLCILTSSSTCPLFLIL